MNDLHKDDGILQEISTEYGNLREKKRESVKYVKFLTNLEPHVYQKKTLYQPKTEKKI